MSWRWISHVTLHLSLLDYTGARKRFMIQAEVNLMRLKLRISHYRKVTRCMEVC
jgi:hypothetical protein